MSREKENPENIFFNLKKQTSKQKPQHSENEEARVKVFF